MGLQGGHQEVLQGVQMNSGKLSMSHEWSRVVSAEIKEEYMTLQGIQTALLTTHISKHKDC